MGIKVYIAIFERSRNALSQTIAFLSTLLMSAALAGSLGLACFQRRPPAGPRNRHPAIRHDVGKTSKRAGTLNDPRKQKG
jgi:hypothetical protein